MGICTWQQRLPIVDVDGFTSCLLGVPSKIHPLLAPSSPPSRPCLPAFVPTHPRRVCVSDTPSKRPQNPTIRRGSWRAANTHLHRDPFPGRPDPSIWHPISWQAIHVNSPYKILPVYGRPIKCFQHVFPPALSLHAGPYYCRRLLPTRSL